MPAYNNGTTGATIVQVMGIVDMCYANGSILDAASSTGLVPSDSLDIKALAQKQLDGLDFKSVSSFDIKYYIH
jgi:hypothetical protein